MDTGGLAQMTYNNNNFMAGGLGAPGSGFASRGGGRSTNLKRLSVALPPKVNSINEDQVDNPTPRTSRSHLLAGLRTAPKSGNGPASAPYSQTQHQYGQSQYAGNGYDGYGQTANSAGHANMQYGNNGYPFSEQVLAPPSFYDQYEQDDEMDPNVLEQLQLTGAFLAQRQQQLQQQLASITAAANQFQGMGLDASMMQQSGFASALPQQYMYAQQQVAAPIEVPGQPGLCLVYNPAIGGYQYVTDNSAMNQTPKRNSASLPRSTSTPSVAGSYHGTPTFRAEISPPPVEKSTPVSSRSITPPKNSSTPPSSLEHVEPLPPPSANAFRRGHKKAPSSLASTALGSSPADGPKTASAATFGSVRAVSSPAPSTGTFGPGAARAGEHPVRQPRGPPPLEELMALPTAKHEGSKNFATRQRRMALNNLMRAGSFRRSTPSNSSPVSERDFILQLSEEDEPALQRKQSPIGSERSWKRGSQSSLEGLGSANTTPASEKGNMFDMSSFAKQLPSYVQQGQDRRKTMLGEVLTAAEKRKSMF